MKEQPAMQLIHARYGDFHVFSGEDLISDSLRLYGEWAQQEIELLLSFIEPGETIVDAGAYIGTHTRAFADRVSPAGSVYAFEPDPASFSLLQSNAQAGAGQIIHPLNLGLGACSETRPLQLDDALHNRASASMTQSSPGSRASVQVRTLDELDIPLIHLMKVDVEGMELQLLSGAEQCIRRDRPIIFLEVNSLAGSAGFLPWADQHGYHAYGINVAAFNPDNHAGATENVFGSAREVGLLLIHSQAIARFAAPLAKLDLPLIDSLDAMALLLLHKPQYVSETLARTDASKHLGLSFATREKHQLREFEELLEAKNLALEDAAQAYAALRNALEQKESDLKLAIDALNQASS